jgi:UDP-N-acetylmuramoyl-L-alanyl-D-glutamate--2,6-diaminopimelate ligase
MGRVAARLADYTVVTSANTWTEEPEAIMAEIVRGLVETGRRPDRDYAWRLDRRQAIELALARARDDDLVLVAGMGGERSMVVAGRPEPWDDRQVIHEVLSARTALAAAR